MYIRLWGARERLNRNSDTDSRLDRYCHNRQDLEDLCIHISTAWDKVGDDLRSAYCDMRPYYCLADHQQIDATRAAAMSKTLNAIGRSLTKATEERGYCADFGEFIVRFCAALGIKTIVMPTGAQIEHEQRADDTSHWLPVGTAVDSLRNLVWWHNAAQERVAKQALKAAAA
jgi:hypothetical protein